MRNRKKKWIILCFFLVCVTFLFWQSNVKKNKVNNDSKSINLLAKETNVKELYTNSQAIKKQDSLLNTSMETEFSNENLNADYQMEYQSDMRNHVIHYKDKIYYIGYDNLLYQTDLYGKHKKVFHDTYVTFPYILYAFKNFIYFSSEGNKYDSAFYRINISNGVKTKLFDGEPVLIDTYTGKIYYESLKYNKKKDMFQKFIKSCKVDGTRKKLLYQGTLDHDLIAVDRNQTYYLLSREDHTLFSYNENKETKKIIYTGSYRFIDSITYDKDDLYFGCYVLSSNADHIDGELFHVKQDGTNLYTKPMLDSIDFSIVKDQLFYCRIYNDYDEGDFYKMDLDFTNETVLLKRIIPNIYPSNAHNWLYYIKNNNIYRYNVLTNDKQLILKRKDYFKSFLKYKENYEEIETRYEDMQVIDDWIYFSFCIYRYQPGNGGRPIDIQKQYCRIKTNGLDFYQFDKWKD